MTHEEASSALAAHWDWLLKRALFWARGDAELAQDYRAECALRTLRNPQKVPAVHFRRHMKWTLQHVRDTTARYDEGKARGLRLSAGLNLPSQPPDGERALFQAEACRALASLPAKTRAAVVSVVMNGSLRFVEPVGSPRYLTLRNQNKHGIDKMRRMMGDG